MACCSLLLTPTVIAPVCLTFLTFLIFRDVRKDAGMLFHGRENPRVYRG